MTTIRLELPYHLRNLAHVGREVAVTVGGEVTQRSVFDALEAAYPMLRGTIRDQTTGKRRPLLRFFACERDLSHESPETPLPAAVQSGAEPLLIVGAVAGG
jgi:sulfur-carrier protein